MMMSKSKINEKNSKRKPGRRQALDYSLIKETLHKYKDKLVSPIDAAITRKGHPVWEEIRGCFPKNASNVPKNAEALYTFVVNDRANIKSEIFKALGVQKNDKTPDTTAHESSGNWENSVLDEERRDFNFEMSIDEYSEITEYREFKRILHGRVVKYKQLKFKLGIWLPVINEKMWFASGAKCGYNNDDSYINKDGFSGNYRGHCTCGSQVHCVFHRDSDKIIFECKTTEGDGKCRNLYLRGPMRLQLGEQLLHQGADSLQAHLARQYKHPESNKRAPLVPNQYVLRKIKSQQKKYHYVADDPIVALTIMKAGEYCGAIHDISLDPFYVHYWTSMQRQVYCKYLATTQGPLFADATGGFPQKFTKLNGEKTRALFLYIGVVNCSAGQFSVAQMISEKHDTITITYFWLRWLQYGFPKPPEVVTDSSRALVTSMILAFTQYKTIEEYADAGLTVEKSDCYIRFDVAHFLKMYSGVLKSAPRLVRVFFMSCLGKLVKMTDKEAIGKFLEELFTLALFESTGPVRGGTRPSLSQKVKDKLIDAITDEDDNFKDGATDEENKGDEDGPNGDNHSNSINDYTLSETDHPENTWLKWALTRKEKVLELAKSEDNGTEVNAYMFPALVDRLVADCRHLPFWSGVTYHKYNYGRLPASSASVECEIKKIKKNMFKNEKTRPDEIVKKHVDYLNGRLIIVEDAMDDLRYDTNDNRFPNSADDENQGKKLSERGISTIVPDTPTDPIRALSPLMSHNESLDDSSSTKNGCVACMRGQIPSAHHCIRCKKAVHILEGCSVAIPGEEEGYGKFRLCVTCSSIPTANTNDLLSKQSMEDWRGEGSEKKKKSRGLYTGGKANKIRDILLLEKAGSLPILQSGQSRGLQPVAIGNRRISLIMTCPFDSYFQILIAAAADYNSVRHWMTQVPHNQLYKMVIDSVTHSLRAWSYRLRGEILANYYKTSKVAQGIELIDCKDEIRNVAKKLFKNTPSWIEKSSCESCGNSRTVFMETISIPVEALCHVTLEWSPFQNWIFPSVQRRCTQGFCQGLEEITENILGDMIIFEPYCSNGSAVQLSLLSLPDYFLLPEGGSKMKLVGVIEFQGPRTRNAALDDVGHYIPICKRRDNSWIIYNDKKMKGEIAPRKYEPNIALIIFCKI